MTPKEAEEYVRGRWEYVSIEKRGETVLWVPKGTLVVRQDNWLAAAEFTKQREEEIRRKREEIEWMSVNGGISPPALRILAILEAQLAALLAGMKETP